MVASVWYGDTVDGIIAADAQGFIEHMFHQLLLKFTMNINQGDGRWTGIYTGYLGY